jgi:hypothetical protein
VSERGVTESTQWAMLIPALMLVVLGTIQAGIWLHGRTVVAHAASAVAEEVAWGGAGEAEAVALGQRIAHDGGLQEVAVVIDRGAEVVRVQVSGRAPLVFDLGLGRLSEHAEMPRELVRR